MKNESDLGKSLSRRGFSGQTMGVAGMLMALAPANSVNAQTQPAGGSRKPRVRESFDFGWRFFKGDAPGAQQPDFTDTGWRGLDLPHDWSIEGPFTVTEIFYP